MNKVIKLDDYKQMKLNKKENKFNNMNNFKKQEDDDRRKTLNLFMRVLATMRKESY